MRWKCNIAVWLVITVFFISLLISCSISGNVFNRIIFWDKANERAALDDNDMKRFVSSVRESLGNADSHYRLANYYQERNMHKAAIEEFKKIILIDPEYIKAYNGIGVSLDKLGYTDRAIGYYEKALNLNSGLDYVLNNLGYAYIRMEKYDQAVDALKKAVEISPRNIRIHNNLGLAYAKKGLFELALNEFILAGDDAKTLYNIGQVYYAMGLYSQAKACFQKTLNISPSFLIAKVWLESADSMTAAGQAPVNGTGPGEKPDGSRQAPEGAGKEELTLNAGPQQSDNQSYSSYEGTGIEVSNGNGINRMARTIGNYLDEKGFKVIRLTNADNFNHKKTIVYYRGEHYQAAYNVARQMPGSHNVEKVHKLDRANIGIKVLIGEDIVVHKGVFTGG